MKFLKHYYPDTSSLAVLRLYNACDHNEESLVSTFYERLELFKLNFVI